MPLGIGRGSGVAVVELHGVIGTQIRAATYSRMFENVAGNKSYRALLLDIDSPGGSATASEALHRSIERVAERKPVFAYVRGLGASGGYYLACAASQVFALPTALVGSIGVIYLRPVLEQLLGRAGIEFSIFKGGKYKDMGAFWRSPTAEESEKFQGLIDEIYDNFVQVVAKGRSLTEERVRELATGELMTAQKAIERAWSTTWATTPSSTPPPARSALDPRYASCNRNALSLRSCSGGHPPTWATTAGHYRRRRQRDTVQVSGASYVPA